MPNPWVNLTQTKAERRRKYKLIRELGYPRSRAIKARDFRLSTIERQFPELEGKLGVVNHNGNISTGGYSINAAGLQMINGVVSPPCPYRRTEKGQERAG